MLLAGPDLLVPLTNVLFKFRAHKIANSGDIRGNFRQVNIRVEDRAAQHFLWRGRNRTQELSVYEMRAMKFCATSSPTTAQFVKNENSARFRETDPEAHYAILHNHYVDDYLDSVSTVDAAIRRANSVMKVHAARGFEIRNWASSSPKVSQNTPVIYVL